MIAYAVYRLGMVNHLCTSCFRDESCLFVVIEPLNAIIKQQLNKLGYMAGVVRRGQHFPSTSSSATILLQNREFMDVFSTQYVKKKKCI